MGQALTGGNVAFPDTPTGKVLSDSGTWIDAGGGVPTPAGVVSMYAGSSAPTGYLLCDGAAVSRATYADLFAAISTTYGPGDGSTTFNVPNLKGRVPVGLDAAQAEFDALGETGGEKTHVLTTPEIPAHSHGVTDPTHNHTQNSFAPRIVNSGTAGTVGVQGASTASNANASNAPTTAVNQAAATGISIQNAGGGGAHQNLQPYLTLNFIVKT